MPGFRRRNYSNRSSNKRLTKWVSFPSVAGYTAALPGGSTQFGTLAAAVVEDLPFTIVRVRG